MSVAGCPRGVGSMLRVDGQSQATREVKRLVLRECPPMSTAFAMRYFIIGAVATSPSCLFTCQIWRIAPHAPHSCGVSIWRIPSFFQRGPLFPYQPSRDPWTRAPRGRSHRDCKKEGSARCLHCQQGHEALRVQQPVVVLHQTGSR